MRNLNTVAVVLASGSGERFGTQKLPKHLTPILGVPILNWTLDAIFKTNLFSAVVVVTSHENLKHTQKSINAFFEKSSIPILLTEGSVQRSESFNLGLQSLINHKFIDAKSIIALFDANRPFVSQLQLQELHKTVQVHECACPGRPVINGVAISSLGKITRVPPKDHFVEFVTPEFLRLDSFNLPLQNFLRGHNCFVEFALDSGFEPVMIKSTQLNAKLTYPEDRTYMEGLALNNKLVVPKAVKIGWVID